MCWQFHGRGKQVTTARPKPPSTLIHCPEAGENRATPFLLYPYETNTAPAMHPCFLPLFLSLSLPLYTIWCPGPRNSAFLDWDLIAMDHAHPELIIKIKYSSGTTQDTISLSLLPYFSVPPPRIFIPFIFFLSFFLYLHGACFPMTEPRTRAQGVCHRCVNLHHTDTYTRRLWFSSPAGSNMHN